MLAVASVESRIRLICLYFNLMKKPKIYELWFSDYDGDSSWQFTHPNNKLRMEFEQDCVDVLKEFASEYIKTYDSWIGTLELVGIIAKNLYTKGYIPFEETFENITFGFGGSCILQEADGEHGDNTLIELLGETLKKQVYDKNKEIEQDIIKIKLYNE